MKKNENRLYRYTSLPVLLDILFKQKLTLLNPASWDDRNDSYYIELYKKKKNLKSLLALCFTAKPETYHHWKVFADGLSGVCIQFDKEKLTNDLRSNSSIDFSQVDYSLIRELRNDPPDIEELPFLKRHPFKDEGEFRVIYKDYNDVLDSKSVTIDIDCIDQIKLSPWIPKAVSRTVKKIIKNIDGCSNLNVNRTTLVDNRLWKNIALKEHGTKN